MKIRDIAKFLGVKKQRIYRLINARKLIAKLNQKRAYEIKAKDFENFMTQFNRLEHDACQLTCLINLSD